MPDHILPFARAATLFGEVSSPSDEGAKRTLGQVYQAKDLLHGTGLPVILRAVQNDAAVAYTIPATGSVYGMAFQSTDREDFGRKINGVLDANGGVAKALDDYYSMGRGPTTIPDHDVCYVVEEGPVSVFKTDTSFTHGQAVAFNSNGKAMQAGTGNYIAGAASTAYTTSQTSMILMAGAGLHATY